MRGCVCVGGWMGGWVGGWGGGGGGSTKENKNGPMCTSSRMYLVKFCGEHAPWYGLLILSKCCGQKGGGGGQGCIRKGGMGGRGGEGGLAGTPLL